MYHSTRSAPTPPRPSLRERRETLPANHPFASPFNPFEYHTTYNYSTSSLSSSAYTPTPTTHSSPSSSRRAPQSPTASLAQPLSPARSTYPASATTSGRRRVDEFCRGRSLTESAPAPAPSPVYATLPTELSLFDARPRQTLLRDVEYILGKKMHFPFLARYTSSSSSPKQEKKAKREGEKEKKTRRRLTKERSYGEDWAVWAGMDSFMDSQVAVVKDKKKRGVREGNWI
ncbi:hypothetical protein IAR50_000929 [Cryptococcus sp. DSM 104548]